MERVKGIEPSQPAWKAGALPLSYTRKLVGKSGFEPLKAKLTDLQSVPFGQLWNIPIYLISKILLELMIGLEPTTY